MSFLFCLCGALSARRKPGKIIDGARQLVVREKGGDYLSPNEIPELLDPELPQQLLVSAFRRYRR